MPADGPNADAVFAFERGGEVITVVPRLVRRVERLGLSDHQPAPSQPGRWRNLDGAEREGTVALAELLAEFPVAILERIA